MMIKVVLPELGEGITQATVACWHARPGDFVQEGDDVVELVTDKAVFNVPATASGHIEKIFFKEGEDAKIGETLAFIS